MTTHAARFLAALCLAVPLLSPCACDRGDARANDPCSIRTDRPGEPADGAGQESPRPDDRETAPLEAWMLDTSVWDRAVRREHSLADPCQAGDADPSGPAPDPAPPAPPADRIDEPARAIDVGLAHLHAGDANRAADCFARAHELAPDDLDALRCLALARGAQGRHEDALAIYLRLRRLAPDDVVARYNAAVTLIRVGRKALAGQMLESLLADHPDHARARANLAALLEADGHVDEAVGHYRRAAALLPDDANAHEALARALGAAGRAEEAMRARAEVAKLRPRDPDAWRAFARWAVRAGSLGRALLAARRVTELDPDDAATWRLRGNLCRRIGEMDDGPTDWHARAREAWARSLSLDGNQPDLRRRLDETPSGG